MPVGPTYETSDVVILDKAVLILDLIFYLHLFQYIPCHTLLTQYTDYPTLTCGYGMTNLYTDLLFIRNILSNNPTSTSHS